MSGGDQSEMDRSPLFFIPLNSYICKTFITIIFRLNNFLEDWSEMDRSSLFFIEESEIPLNPYI